MTHKRMEVLLSGGTILKKPIGTTRYTCSYVDKRVEVIKFNKDRWEQTFDEIYSMEHEETSIFIKQMD